DVLARQTSPIPGTWVPWPGKRTAIPTGWYDLGGVGRVTPRGPGGDGRGTSGGLAGVQPRPQLSHEVGRPVGAGPFEEAADEGGADDHPVGVGRRLRRLGGRGDADADEDGLVGDRLQALGHEGG